MDLIKLIFLSFSRSRPARLRDIADRFNLDQEAVLDNVLYARAYTSKICFIHRHRRHNAFNLRCIFTFATLVFLEDLSYLRISILGEHQHELLDFVAAKFHEEMGVFKLLVNF